MISCTLEPMPADTERVLRIWLGKNEMQHLVRTAEAQEKLHQCEALKAVSEAKEFPAKFDAANESLRKAQKYTDFLEVLKQLTSQQEPYTIAKLT